MRGGPDDYLSWFKGELPRWSARGCIDLASSAVSGNESGLDELIRRGRTSAADMQYGHEGLRRALAGHLGVPESAAAAARAADFIIPTSGASSAIFIALTALRRLMLAHGKPPRAIVEAPTYRPLYSVSEYVGFEMATFRRHASDGYRLRPEALRAALGGVAQPVVVIASNLHNPTSAESSAADFDALLAAAPAGSYVLVDETFINASEKRDSVARLRNPHLVSIGSLSKDPGLGSLRCGWISAFGETLTEVRRAWVHAFNIGSPVTEAAAFEALSEVASLNASTEALLASNRHLVEAVLTPLQAEGLISWSPSARGCVIFPELSVVRAEKTLAARRAKLWQFYESAVNDAGVAVVPGDLFNPAGELDAGEANIRVGLGVPTADLREGLVRLSKHIREFSQR